MSLIISTLAGNLGERKVQVHFEKAKEERKLYEVITVISLREIGLDLIRALATNTEYSMTVSAEGVITHRPLCGNDAAITVVKVACGFNIRLF